GVESTPGKGSKFWFAIPGSTTLTEEPVPAETLGYEPLHLTGKTILVAEDEETNYILVEEILRNFNSFPLWVKDGKRAVEICRTNPDIDLVLMDVKMPIMDGYSATLLIKEF